MLWCWRFSRSPRPAEAEGNKTCSVNPLCADVGWLRPERHEKVVVTDNRTDGYGAIMRFEYYSPEGLRGDRVFIVDTHNDGDPTRLNLDIREGWSFSFTVCLWKDSNTVTTTCGRAQVLKT